MDILTCSFCSEVLSGFNSFKTHMENVHDFKSTSTPTRKIICKSHDCNKEYSQGRTLFKHIRRYHCREEHPNYTPQPVADIQPKSKSKNKEFPFDALMADMITNL